MMFYEQAKASENRFIEEQKAACRKRGFELTFESEIIMRHAFSRGWDAVASAAYDHGRKAAQADVRFAIGAASDRWEPES
jgi:hypothetical protein